MSKNYAIIIQFVPPLTPLYRSGARRSDVYQRDAFVTSWRSHNRTWQPERHDRLPETSGTLWIHRGALTNQRCSLATGCGIKGLNDSQKFTMFYELFQRVYDEDVSQAAQDEGKKEDQVWKAATPYSNVTSLAPGKCSCYLNNVIFELILWIIIMCISHEIALKWWHLWW